MRIFKVKIESEIASGHHEIFQKLRLDSLRFRTLLILWDLHYRRRRLHSNSEIRIKSANLPYTIQIQIVSIRSSSMFIIQLLDFIIHQQLRSSPVVVQLFQFQQKVLGLMSSSITVRVVDNQWIDYLFV